LSPVSKPGGVTSGSRPKPKREKRKKRTET
jgi:hypothetical protein